MNRIILVFAVPPLLFLAPSGCSSPPAAQSDRGFGQSQLKQAGDLKQPESRHEPQSLFEQRCGFRPSGPIMSHSQSEYYRGGCLEPLIWFEGEIHQGVIAGNRLRTPYAHDKSGEPLEVEIIKAGDEVDVTSQGDVPLYKVLYNGVNLCEGVRYDASGVEGERAGSLRHLEGRAIAVEGHWTDGKWQEQALWEGEGMKKVLTLSCLSGVIAKCVHWGYLPWATHRETGTPLGRYHRACVQAARAMYNDGPEKDTSFTFEGTNIDIYDRLGIQKKEGVALFTFESLWSEEGLRCMVRSRWPNCKELEGTIQATKAGCTDPVPVAAQHWPPKAYPEALIAVASSPGNSADRCPNRRNPKP